MASSQTRRPVAIFPLSHLQQLGRRAAATASERVRLEHGSLNLRYRRNLKVFDGEDLCILKPLYKRYWCRTAALNDADEIAAATFPDGLVPVIVSLVLDTWLAWAAK
jgi:hypothetical protein